MSRPFGIDRVFTCVGACVIGLGLGSCTPSRFAHLPPRRAAFAGCGDAGAGPAVAAGATDAAVATRVLLISVDGLRPDGLVEAPAVNLLGLTCRGARSWQARTVSPSMTLPAHASMISGYAPGAHGLLWNDLRPGHIAVPTVFAAAKRAGLRTVMVVGKDKLFQLAPPGTVDAFVFAPGGDEDVAANAIAEIGQGFDLMFVHFPLVDLAGHVTTWMSETYLRQVVAADAAIGRVLAALPPETTVIVSADHGGKGFSHYAEEPEDVTIPWIIAGPGVRAGHVIEAPIATTDTAATIARVLSLPLPGDQSGRPVEAAFSASTAGP